MDTAAILRDLTERGIDIVAEGQRVMARGALTDRDRALDPRQHAGAAGDPGQPHNRSVGHPCRLSNGTAHGCGWPAPGALSGLWLPRLVESGRRGCASGLPGPVTLWAEGPPLPAYTQIGYACLANNTPARQPLPNTPPSSAPPHPIDVLNRTARAAATAFAAE